MTESQSWKSWAGYAFEGICMKHSDQIRKKLQIDRMSSEVATWRFVPPKTSEETGAQIDLLFDRSDGIISVCEIKYSDNEFAIDKSYAKELERKLAVFRTKTTTRKHISLTLITSFGAKKNEYYNQLVSNEVTLEDLFG